MYIKRKEEIALKKRECIYNVLCINNISYIDTYL